jgi:hypothetical protein
VSGTTDLLGRIRFRTTGGAGDYTLELTDVAAGGLAADRDAFIGDRDLTRASGAAGRAAGRGASRGAASTSLVRLDSISASSSRNISIPRLCAHPRREAFRGGIPWAVRRCCMA